MTDKEALEALIDAALISESDKARLLSMLPDMSDDDVKKLGEVFAQEQQIIDAHLDEALSAADAFLAANADAQGA